MKTKAQMWGNSLAVRVPKGIAEKAGIRPNDEMQIEVKEGAIILLPHVEYRLNDLLKGITKDNLHDEIDFGESMGGELL